jgi:hypothetical protein
MNAALAKPIQWYLVYSQGRVIDAAQMLAASRR